MQRAALAQERPFDEQEALAVFYDDPEVADRMEAIQRTGQARNSATRISRKRSDPAVVHSKSRVKTLEDEVAQLWQKNKGSILEKLRGHEETEAIRHSEPRCPDAEGS